MITKACLQTLAQNKAVHGGRLTQAPLDQRQKEAEILVQLACWSAETGQAAKESITGVISHSQACWSTPAREKTSQCVFRMEAEIHAQQEQTLALCDVTGKQTPGWLKSSRRELPEWCTG